LIPIEALGWFLLGAGATGMVIGGTVVVRGLIGAYRRFKFERYLENIRKNATDAVEEAVKGQREVSELTFRDKSGVMNTVRIVIDPNVMDKFSDEEKDQVAKRIMAGEEGGSLQELVDGTQRISEDAMGKVQEFIFSPNSVKRMRQQGMEPDEVVTMMLRSAGRMD